MVKIRLQRLGSKGKPFYRVVVTPSVAGRSSNVVEIIGTYDPISKEKLTNINEDRALYWLRNGAQPTETTAYLLKKTGILGKFLEERPTAAKSFKFLDKTTRATSKVSVVDAPSA